MLMFSIKLSLEKQIKKFWAAGFSDLPAINATVFKIIRVWRRSLKFSKFSRCFHQFFFTNFFPQNFLSLNSWKRKRKSYWSKMYSINALKKMPLWFTKWIGWYVFNTCHFIELFEYKLRQNCTPSYLGLFTL